MLSLTRWRISSTFVSLAVVLTESQLFDYLKTAYISDLEASGDRYDYHDCQSHKKKLHIELKSRQTHYDELILEKDKYDALIGEAKRLGYTPWYINSTPQGVYAFNLKLIKMTWTVRQLPASTAFNNVQTISKTVTYIHISKAAKL